MIEHANPITMQSIRNQKVTLFDKMSALFAEQMPEHDRALFAVLCKDPDVTARRPGAHTTSRKLDQLELPLDG